MNETIVGLLLDLEVYWSQLTSNQSVDLGSQRVLSNMIAQSLNQTTAVNVFYHFTNFTSDSTPPDLFYNATSYLSSYVSITNTTDSESVLEEATGSLSDTMRLRSLLTSELKENHINCSYNASNPYYAINLVNSTLNMVNIASYAWQYSSDDNYYSSSSSDNTPVYRFKDHEVSIIIGIIVVGLASIAFIMLNFFPVMTYRLSSLLAKSCFRYHLLNSDTRISNPTAAGGGGRTEIV